MKILETNNYFSFIFLQFHYLNFFVQKNLTKNEIYFVGNARTHEFHFLNLPRRIQRPVEYQRRSFLLT